MATFHLAYSVRAKDWLILGWITTALRSLSPTYTVGHCVNRRQQEIHMVLTRKGMDETYKVKRQRIVWLLAHPIQAHGEGVGFVSSGSEGRLCFCNCSMGCFLERCWLCLFKLGHPVNQLPQRKHETI